MAQHTDKDDRVDKPSSPATLMDVAAKAGVSIATASRVLNGSTRKVRNDSYVKVMEAATKLKIGRASCRERV